MLNLPNCFNPTSTHSRLLFCSLGFWICLLCCQYSPCIISLQFPGYQYICGLQSSTFSLLLPTSYISNTSIRCMYTAAQVRSGEERGDVISSIKMATLSPQISLPVGTSAMVANISLIWTNSRTVMNPIDPLGVIQGEDMGV